MMIKIFGQTDTEYSSNGDIVLKPTKCRIHQKDNGEYYAEIECSSDYAEYIQNGRIVVCPTPTGEQPFRFLNPEISRNKIKVKAKHRYYDSENYLIRDSYVVDKNCAQALEHLNAATDTTSPFITVSDVTSINSFRCVRKSLSEAVNTVLERWGGHLVRDKNIIAIRSSIGADNGVTIRYGKNLKEIKKSEDWNNVVTKLLPVGKDGLMLDEIYLYSDQQYALPYTKTVSFTQEIEQAEGETDEAYILRLKDDLRQQATAYLTANCVPKINYTVKANIEKITDIGDTIEVIDETLGIDLITHVIAFEYDCILEKFVQVEFGNSKEKLSSLMSNVAASTSQQITQRDQELSLKLSGEISEATGKIWDTLNIICIGSQQLYDQYDFTAAGIETLLGASDYDLIEGIFNGITIPDGYEKAYRITAQVTTQDENTVGASISEMTCSGGTRSGTTFRIPISSGIVKESNLTLEPVLNYSSENGLNLTVTNSGNYNGSIYNITLHGYLVKTAPT